VASLISWAARQPGSAADTQRGAAHDQRHILM